MATAPRIGSAAGTPGPVSDITNSQAVARLGRLRYTDVTVGASGRVRVFGNSRRMAIGFALPTNLLNSGTYAGPFPPDSNTFGWLLDPENPLWFDTGTYSALVPGEWWLVSNLGATVRVMESYIM